jgi:hypothetical protein
LPVARKPFQPEPFDVQVQFVVILKIDADVEIEARLAWERGSRIDVWIVGVDPDGQIGELAAEDRHHFVKSSELGLFDSH